MICPACAPVLPAGGPSRTAKHHGYLRRTSQPKGLGQFLGQSGCKPPHPPEPATNKPPWADESPASTSTASIQPEWPKPIPCERARWERYLPRYLMPIRLAAAINQGYATGIALGLIGSVSLNEIFKIGYSGQGLVSSGTDRYPW